MYLRIIVGSTRRSRAGIEVARWALLAARDSAFDRAELNEADAYLIVSPEYNRSVPGVLKNALDHVAFEMSGKPVSSITYGSSGGAQAHASLKIIPPTLEAAVIPASVFLFPQQVAAMSEDGEGVEQAGPAADALKGTLDQLHRYALVLSSMRTSAQPS